MAIVLTQQVTGFQAHMVRGMGFRPNVAGELVSGRNLLTDEASALMSALSADGIAFRIA